MSAVVELDRAVTLIPQHPAGPLRIEILDGAVWLRADQVEQLAGIPAWSTGETLIDEQWTRPIGKYEYYELATATARCEAAETDPAAAFLAWLSSQLEQLLTDEVLDAAHQVPGFIGSYPVKRAAAILDRDPRISMGQNRLFAHMASLGWIVRDDVTEPWMPTPLARRRGWLTTRTVPLPVGAREARIYPQTYVTPAGLDELHTSLLGSAAAGVLTLSTVLFD